MAMGDAVLPGAIGARFLPSLPVMPAYWAHGMNPFHEPPTLLVLHSGARGDNVARYLANPLAREGDKGAIKCKDGRWRRQVGVHISASSQDGDFHSQAALDLSCWGARGSICQGRGWVNGRAIQVELPAHEGAQLLESFRGMLGELVQVVPSLEAWTLHRWIKAKLDPVCWSDDRCREAMEGAGLVEVR